MRNGDRARLRLLLVTDGLADLGRIEQVMRAALRGGCRSVQLREPKWSARQMLQACERLRPIADEAGAWLLVNDRVDVAATGVAHGAHIGHRSLPPELARRVLGEDLVLGFSAHDAEELTAAAEQRCDFATLSPVWPTNSKPDAAFLGVQRAVALTAEARLPVAWLGGVDIATIGELRRLELGHAPTGVAVRSAIMSSQDPELETRELIEALPA